MDDTGMIFCCGCESIVSMTNVRHVFRTGFYRIKYPLGCCQDCALINVFAELAVSAEENGPTNLQPGVMNNHVDYI